MTESEAAQTHSTKTQGAGPPPRVLRSWRSVLFAPVGDRQRRRRGSDGLRLALAAATLVCCLLLIRYDSRVDRAIAQVIHPPPWSIAWLVTLVYWAGWVGAVAGVAALALAARRREMVRDIGLSAAATAAVCGIAILLLGSRGGRPAGIVIGAYVMRFPVWQAALFMAVTTTALPYLARGVQRLTEILIALVALAAAVGGQGLAVNVLGSLAIGWGVTAAVRLVFGSPAGLPSAEDVRLLLAEFGIHAVDVRPAARQLWGVARYNATDQGAVSEMGTAAGEGRLAVAVYGRDAADARLLTKAGRFLLYRDSGPSLTLTRLQQVEHEAFLTLRAARAGAAVPDLVEAGTAGPARDALLLSRLPPGGVALADADPGLVGDAVLDDLYRQLLILRRARIAHGAISGDAVLLDPAAQSAMLAEFRNASILAEPDRLDRDLAGALAATAVSVGAERAAAAAARSLPPPVLAATLRQLQKPCLDPLLVQRLRGDRQLLGEVRRRAADAGAIELPPLVEPRRVSWPTLIMIIGTLIGGWALIGVLLNVAGSFDTVIGADWLWVIMTLVLAQLAYVARAVEGVGSVAGPLPFGRAVAVEFANAFSGLAGGAAAVFATRVRFLQKQGYDATVALSSGAIMTTANWAAIIVVFAVALPFSSGAFRLAAAPQSGGDSKLVWIILAVVVAVAVAAGLLLAVPRLRRLAASKLLPRLRDIWGQLRQVASSPRKLMLLVGGSLAQQLLVAMALSVALRAFGDHVRLPTLIVVITLAGFIGGVSPAPGGVGVVEAGLILGLTSAGITEANATAAVFIQRVCTSYLPPVWGWMTLVWMRRREYL